MARCLDSRLSGYSRLWRPELDLPVKEPAAVGEAGGGIAPSLLGTAILVTIASCVGMPLGLGVGIYLSELAGDTRFARLTRLAINTFIGVPSIVAGIFVYFVLVKPTNTFSAAPAVWPSVSS